jgi:NitT/TauT family transport system substrate-binding protein
MSHSGVGLDRIEIARRPRSRATDLFGLPMAEEGLWFSGRKFKPYTFNSAPFIADKHSIEQGYVTSEPSGRAARQVKPNVFLIADYGYDPIRHLIETTRLHRHQSDLVQRFVDASIIGWYNYIYGDNRAANALIKREIPTSATISCSFGCQEGIRYCRSGDLTLGIGATRRKAEELL